MIYLELMIATEDGEDWIDLVAPDEIDDVVDNWHDYDSPARLVSLSIMSGPRVDYALNWRTQPHLDWNSMVEIIADNFPTTS